MTSPAPSSRPSLDRIEVGGPLAPWERLGLTPVGETFLLGDVALRIAGGEPGIRAWALHGVPAGELAGLRCASAEDARPAIAVEHALGVSGIDHVVAVTADLDAAVGELAAAGLDHRRTRDAGEGRRQAFFVLGPCLLELVGPVDGPTRFWGLTLVVEDLDAAAARLGDLLGPVKDAVQPGRRIATVRREAGLGLPVALMTPRH